jgi:hypothetical protein
MLVFFVKGSWLSVRVRVRVSFVVDNLRLEIS